MEHELSPKEKAAILMVALGRESSAKIYEHLSEDEIEQLTLSITSIRTFDSETKDAVLEEFRDICLAKNFIEEGGIDYARDVLVRAMGEEKADALIGKLSASLQVRPFDFVRKADPAQVLNFIRHEHPQTIALVMSYLDPKQAGMVVSSLDPEIQRVVIERIATMTVASPDYIREAERVLERKLSSIDLAENTVVGGIESVVEILGAVDRSTEKMILEAIQESDPELVDEIHRRMFVFEDIINLPGLIFQRIIKDVDTDVLTIALKGASEEISKMIYANISKRMAETIKENMDYMGPVRVKDVENAQQTIVNVIRRLEDAGEIEISRGGAGDEYV